MNHHDLSTWMRGRAMAAVACAALAAPMLGCGSGSSGGENRANLPPIDDTQGGRMATQPMSNAPAPHQGMSTKKKLVLLAGAAALYYLYRKHQANKANQTTAQNGEPVYYLSKNGRVYYRDAAHQAHWVTPPSQPIQIDPNEAQQYPGLQGLQGYDGSTTGDTDLSRFYTPSGAGGM